MASYDYSAAYVGQAAGAPADYAAAALAQQFAAGAPFPGAYGGLSGGGGASNLGYGYSHVPEGSHPGTYRYPTAPPGNDEPRTIFISGFPADCKERELNNLMRFLPGYEASQMNSARGLPQGFALFSSGALAHSACKAINQLCFDDTSVLRCEMARKNMYVSMKDDPTIKKPRTVGVGPHGAALGMPGAPQAGFPGRVGLPYPSGRLPGGGLEVDNPPCNTLFVGNLGEGVDEAELQELFALSPGFKHLKVVRGPRATTCFIEYDSIESATAMHLSRQDAVLKSSDRGAIRVQYAKNPFGKKRDVSGALVETLPRDYPAPGTST